MATKWWTSAGNFVAALTERRDGQADHIQPVEQIFAETALFDEPFEVGVGGGDDADVDVEGTGLAERIDLAGLEKAQQLRLQIEAELADLVEKERAVLRRANQPRVVAIGAGEGAAAVSEQLAFEQFARDGRAVERHERLVRACGIAVNGAREDFLAGAALAGDAAR